MTIILSLSEFDGAVWAAGPYGLFQVTDEGLVPTPQPQERLTAVCALDDRILTGGAPHGVAYLLHAADQWQAAWLEGASAPVLTFAPAPDYLKSGLILAGSEGDGVLRSQDRGLRWAPSTFGLRNLTVLTLMWAPPMPQEAWPRWDVVFAGTEEGVYRSPNGGLGWRRCQSGDAAYQTIAVGADFHATGLVLAGAEEDGLWRSEDGGRSFAQVAEAPAQINALVALDDGWLLSDDSQLWRGSADGRAWSPIENSQPALCLLRVNEQIYAGGEDGVRLLSADGQSVKKHLQAPEELTLAG